MPKYSINTQLQAVDMALQLRSEFRKRCQHETEAEYLYAALVAARETLTWCAENREAFLEWRQAVRELDAQTPDP